MLIQSPRGLEVALRLLSRRPASLAALDGALSARMPTFAMATAALASLAALDASLSARTPAFESAVAAHAAVVPALLAALDASLSVRTTLFSSAAAARVAAAQERSLRVLRAMLRSVHVAP